MFIIESTSPVGTTNKMAKLFLIERPELKRAKYILLTVQKEFYQEKVIYELENNDRVIGGIR